MKNYGFATKAIHVGQEPDPTTGAVTVPIYQTSTFAQEEPGKHRGYEYSRTGNPTRTALEKCLAALEEGKYCLTFASGMAAISAITTMLKSGDHVIACDDLYGGTRRLFEKILRNYSISFSYVDATTTKNVEAIIKSNTKMIWIETPTNPLLKIIDIKGISSIAKKHRILTVVDNTFASPYFQKPLLLGADIVIHSTTKYISGHSDVVGGAVITSNKEIYERLKFVQNAVGAIPSPFDSWLVLRGVRTLAIRMEKHWENAQKISEFLEEHPKIEKVIYPGLKSHPQHRLARKQMTGFSGIVSFEIKKGKKAAKQFLKNLKLFKLAESLGGVESLIEHPALMTHASIPKKDREKIGITGNLVRASIGIEDSKDLMQDLDNALTKI
jgi:cystathionine beta-lyase/cystathionine gamma-synthase